MSAFKVKLSRNAAKQATELPGNVQSRVLAALVVIQHNPMLGIKLRGELEGSRRYRVGDYRIIYQVLNSEQTILVENILHRSRAYRRS